MPYGVSDNVWRHLPPSERARIRRSWQLARAAAPPPTPAKPTAAPRTSPPRSDDIGGLSAGRAEHIAAAATLHTVQPISAEKQAARGADIGGLSAARAEQIAQAAAKHPVQPTIAAHRTNASADIGGLTAARAERVAARTLGHPVQTHTTNARTQSADIGGLTAARATMVATEYLRPPQATAAGRRQTGKAGTTGGSPVSPQPVRSPWRATDHRTSTHHPPQSIPDQGRHTPFRPREPRPLPLVGVSIARPIKHVFSDPAQTLTITVTYEAEISGGGPIKLRVDPAGHKIGIQGKGFNLSDSGLASQMELFAGINWANSFGNHVGAAGTLDVSHPHHATFSVESGARKTVRVGQGEFNFSADLAVHPLRWGQQLTYTESLSANVALPDDAGELAYSITVEIAPNPKPPRPRSGGPTNEIPVAVLAAGGAATLAALARAAYGRGVIGTRINEPLYGLGGNR